MAQFIPTTAIQRGKQRMLVNTVDVEKWRADGWVPVAELEEQAAEKAEAEKPKATPKKAAKKG